MSTSQLTEALRDIKQLVLSGCDIEAVITVDTILQRIKEKEITPGK